MLFGQPAIGVHVLRRRGSESFKADRPQRWSPTGFQFVGGQGFAPYALHPDGKRVAVAAENVSEVDHTIVFMSNFFDYLKKIAGEAIVTP